MHNSNQPWFASDPQRRLSQQVSNIQKINDPSTSADEMLKVGKVIFILLLGYSGLLSLMNYYANFLPSFGRGAALFMAAALAVVIEYGKSFFAKWTCRIPAFLGLAFIGQTPIQTLRFVSMAIFAAATFYMSFLNSTAGGQQLARQLRESKEITPFSPNTSDIDAQITAVTNSISQNQTVTYKGVMTYLAQKSNTRLSETLNNLQNQRAESIRQQRADWEAAQSRQEGNRNFAVSLIMQSGGWVELLQLLLVVFIVMNERTLLVNAAHKSQYTPSPTPTPSPTTSFNAFSNGSGATPPPNNSTFFNYTTGGTQIGFRRPSTEPVSQSDTGVTQINNEAPSVAAFQHNLTALRRDCANLKNGNGTDRSISERIATAMDGMIYNLPSLDYPKREGVRAFIVQDFMPVHEGKLANYTVEPEQTPMRVYLSQLNKLISLLQINNNANI